MSLSLEIKGVSKSFGRKAVLKDINIEAKGSDIIGLIGRSGCGKSTLLKILVGYYKPDSGRIMLNGKSISDDIMETRRMVGYTTQENSFYEKLSVIENMRYYARLYSLKRSASKVRIKMLLEQVGLFEHRKTLAGNISGGMKRRLDFAISLIHNPAVLILDEPTAGLDPILIEHFWSIVKDVVAKEKKIVLMSSHILSEIEKYCTKAMVVDNGVISKVLSKSRMKGLEVSFRDIVGRNR